MYGEFPIERERIDELRMSDDPTSFGRCYREAGDFIISLFDKDPNLELSLIKDPGIWIHGIPLVPNSIQYLLAYVGREFRKRNKLLVVYPEVETENLSDPYTCILKDVKMKVAPI